jgi:hypothetical protein
VSVSAERSDGTWLSQSHWIRRAHRTAGAQGDNDRKEQDGAPHGREGSERPPFRSIERIRRSSGRTVCRSDRQSRFLVTGACSVERMFDSNESLLVSWASFGDYLEVVTIPDGSVRWSREFPGRSASHAFFAADGTQVAVGVSSRPGSDATQDDVGLFVLDARTGEVVHHERFGNCGAELPEIDTSLSACRLRASGQFSRRGCHIVRRATTAGRFDRRGLSRRASNRAPFQPLDT